MWTSTNFKFPCYYVLIIFSSQHVLEVHRLMFKRQTRLPSVVSFSNYLYQGVLYKAENWHALSHEQYFSKHRFFFVFFSTRVFFHGHWQLTGQQGKGGDLFLFHSTISTRSRTFRHSCATFARFLDICQCAFKPFKFYNLFPCYICTQPSISFSYLEMILLWG